MVFHLDHDAFYSLCWTVNLNNILPPFPRNLAGHTISLIRLVLNFVIFFFFFYSVSVCGAINEMTLSLAFGGAFFLYVSFQDFKYTH